MRVIIQDKIPKSGIQYLVIELLSAIETCKEYKNILLGYQQPITIITAHKNNTFNGLKASNNVLLWLLLLVKYGRTFESC
jgi:hypothetical protein